MHRVHKGQTDRRGHV